MSFTRGGHWPRKGVWGCAALKTPFSHLSCSSQGSYFKQKSPFTASICTQILALTPPNLEIFSSQAPKLGNFQFTSPQIWKFSAHKPPFSEANSSLQAPHFGNPGCTPLPEKKLSGPPPRVFHQLTDSSNVVSHERNIRWGRGFEHFLLKLFFYHICWTHSDWSKTGVGQIENSHSPILCLFSLHTHNQGINQYHLQKLDNRIIDLDAALNLYTENT